MTTDSLELEPRRRRIGMLTPSSNTVLEGLSFDMTSALDDVSVHFGRFSVTEISTTTDGLAQFDRQPMVEAARLLGHAHLDALVWNGTSGGWLGFDEDRELCAELSAASGAAATTSVLALNAVLDRLGATRFGLVTPYASSVQDRVVATYREAGYDCIAERHLGITDNDTFSRVPAHVIETMIRDVATAAPDVIVTFCTNLRAAPLAQRLEAELGITILDTTSLAVWAGLVIAGADASRVEGWGRLFAVSPEHLLEGRWSGG
jgi:maleate isomerase